MNRGFDPSTLNAALEGGLPGPIHPKRRIAVVQQLGRHIEVLAVRMSADDQSRAAYRQRGDDLKLHDA